MQTTDGPAIPMRLSVVSSPVGVRHSDFQGPCGAMWTCDLWMMFLINTKATNGHQRLRNVTGVLSFS